MLDHWDAATRLDSISRLQASAFRTWLAKYTYTRSPAKGATRYTLSDASIRKHIATAKQIMKWAADRDIIAVNPFGREKVGSAPAQEQWQYVDEATFQKVLDACPNEAWRRAFSLARRAGLRLNEIVRAEWSWLDWQARTISVVPKLRNGRRQASTKQSFRTVPLSPDLYKLLLDGFAGADSGLICPHLGSSPSHAADKIIARAKLGWSKPMHTLRKSLETDWLEQHPLPDVCKWLGHDPTIAIKVYHKTKQGRVDAVTGQNQSTKVSSDATQMQEAP